MIDACTFEPALSERAEARIPDGGNRFELAADPTPGATNRVTVSEWIVINEIHYHPLS